MNKTLYEMTKMYGAGKGESMMWDTVRVISDAVPPRGEGRKKAPGCQ